MAGLCEQHLGVTGERCVLFPSLNAAEHCREWLVNQSTTAGSLLPVRIARCPIPQESVTQTQACGIVAEIHITLFPTHAFPLAKQFWQNVGMGISSRLAEYCLALLSKQSSQPINLIASPSCPHDNLPRVATALVSDAEDPNENRILDRQNPCIEHEFISGASAKYAIRSRIAELLQRHKSGRPATTPEVAADDVFLYPTGMCAIWNVHNIASKARPASKSVCFGCVFLYFLHRPTSQSLAPDLRTQTRYRS